MQTAASVAVGGLTPRVDACELCSTGGEMLRASVLVWHPRGGATQVAVCDRCTAAVRRLIALAGAAGSGGPAQILVRTELSPAVQDVESVVVDLVGEPTLIHEFTDPFRAADGRLYTVCVWGQGRADGTWIGWLLFVPRAGGATRRTPRETTQSNREQLYYWATGVEPAYLTGAFRRAS